jgi:TRAP-type C4-dicarboxylate transport system permease small subunit
MTALPGHAAAVARRLARGMAVAAIFGLLLLAIGTAADVVLRYLFASPIRGFVDVTALAGAVLLAACMPHVVASRGNIAVDFLGQRLGPVAARRLDAFAAAATAAFFSLMAWQYVRYALEMRQTGESMPVLRWPVWPWWAAVAVCIAVTALVGFATIAPARTEEAA